MKTLEIVFGNSCYHTLRNSKIDNDILMINILFNVGDLSNIENYNIKIPKELCLDEKNDNVLNEVTKIIENINKNNKIRVWSGRNDIYSYLIMLFISSIIKKYDYSLYAVYSDDYNKEYPSPAVMREEELENLTKFERKLSKKEINNNAGVWEKLVRENTDLRIIENGVVKSVSIDYYDEYILKNLKMMGEVKMAQLVGKLMQNVYLQDILYVYLIEKLIKDKKIKIILNNNIRYFENLIEIIEN